MICPHVVTFIISYSNIRVPGILESRALNYKLNSLLEAQIGHLFPSLHLGSLGMRLIRWGVEPVRLCGMKNMAESGER